MTAQLKTADVVDGLVTDHLWLADRLALAAAGRYPDHVSVDELRSAASVGLVEAAHRYDPTTGVPFAAYAHRRVSGEIVEEVRSKDLASRRLRRRLRDVAGARERVEARTGTDASRAEIAAELGVDEAKVDKWMADGARITDPASVDLAAEMLEGSVDPAVELGDIELVGAIREAVADLPDPLAEVVRRSYWEGERLTDIASDMGVTTQRVAQLRVEGHAAIAEWLSGLGYSTSEFPAAGGVARRAAFCASMAARSTMATRLAAGKATLYTPPASPAG